ncbi:MAG: hypothetical protein H7288_06305 [Kineosporiaceae bacterium]|nr:hypothetical protein [Aeromicrobium sp.]
MNNDFFANAMAGPERDRYDRPMLVPAGMPGGARAAYTRASSFADRVKDKRHIHTWEKRYLARGMGLRPDLQDLAAGELYTSSKLTEDAGKNRQSGKNLDDIIKRALDHVGIHFLADRGTAIHSFCEDRDRLFEVPEHLRTSVEGYWAAVDEHGLQLLGIEMFIANDHVMAAGTFDSLVRHPEHGVCVGDIKTGDIDPGYAIQLAIYANGELYNTDTDERQPLEALSGGEEINRDIGLIFDVKPEGTKIIEVDLVKGWALTQAIKMVVDDLRMDLFTEVKSDPILQAISEAETEIALIHLWNTSGGNWRVKHIKAADARKKEITS